MLQDSDYGLLKQIPIFSELSTETMRRLLTGMTVHRFPEGSVLFHQGEYPDFLHILLEGQVGLIGVGGDGEQTVVDVLQPVDLFIMAAALTSQPYLMTARTLADSRLLLIPAAEMRRQVAEDPKLAVGMLASLSRHYRLLVRQIKDLKLRSATQRLGCHLLALTPDTGDERRVVLPYEKRMLAAKLGMTPENLSRAFANLRRYKVTVSGQQVVLGDVPALIDFCRPDKLEQ